MEPSLVNRTWLANSYCGYRMTQLWVDFFLWEHVLNEEGPFHAIIELGTAHGGFALYLRHQAHERGSAFYTFDCVDPVRDDPFSVFGADGVGRVADLGTDFRKVDVLGNPEEVRYLLDAFPRVLLFCDNGNKAKEVELYHSHLKSGSILGVHDWYREIFPEDIPDHLVELYGAECDEINSLTRFFKVP